MPSLLEFILLAFAVWRVTSMIALEDGPWDIFAKFRKFVGVDYDEYRQPTIFNTTFAKGIVCVWCASMWVAFVGAFASPYSVNVLGFILSWLALSALAILIDEAINAVARTNR